MDFHSLSLEFIRNSQEAFNLNLGFSESDVNQLDTLIDNNLEKISPDIDKAVVIWGAYLGETIRKNLGGTWVFDPDDGWCMHDFGNSELFIYPFSRIRRRFIYGMSYSISTYYQMLRHLSDT